MDKPKCRLCGDRHYGLCAVPVVEVRKLVAAIPAKPSPIAPPEPKFDRVTYQREYMRGYRARKRGGVT